MKLAIIAFANGILLGVVGMTFSNWRFWLLTFWFAVVVMLVKPSGQVDPDPLPSGRD